MWALHRSLPLLNDLGGLEQHVLGDGEAQRLGSYIVADCQRPSVPILRERYADTDQGGLANPDSIRIGVV